MKGGWFSKCGSRLSAAHIHFEHLQELHGLKAIPFQNVALASAPPTFISTDYKRFTDSHDQRTRRGV
eukprot:3471805-Pyramimonas_sp.AAC.1